MYCNACGEQVPDGARFCRACGAAVDMPATPEEGLPSVPATESTVAPPVDATAMRRTEPFAESYEQPTVSHTAPTRVGTSSAPRPGDGAPSAGREPGGGAPGGHGPGGPSGSGVGGPGGKSNRTLWIVIAVLAVIVVALAIAVPLVMARDGEEDETTTTEMASTTTTVTEETTTTMRPTTTDAPTTTTTIAAGPVGDSSGDWVEMDIPGLPTGLNSVAVSNDSLVVQAGSGAGSKLYAYSFISGNMEELPTGSGQVGGADVDKDIAVWWEGTYDEAAGSYTDQHIYSYAFPEGPRNEVAGNTDKVLGYPQIAGIWETWVESSPWETSPDEYWRMPIYGAFVSVGSGSANEPQQLVPSAIATILGDAVWTYSLGETYLAWEQNAADGGFETGSYVLDLMDPSKQPVYLGSDAWRPSISLDNVVFWDEGIKLLNLASGSETSIDVNGDFPTAAPTYAAYYRSNGAGYEIVARGFTGAHEQVLADATDAPPWLSPAIAACGNYVAFVTNQTLHVFEWKGRSGE